MQYRVAPISEGLEARSEIRKAVIIWC